MEQITIVDEKKQNEKIKYLKFQDIFEFKFHEFKNQFLIHFFRNKWMLKLKKNYKQIYYAHFIEFTSIININPRNNLLCILFDD